MIIVIVKIMVIMPPYLKKSFELYPPGPATSAFAWWVGIKNVLQADNATISAKSLGSIPNCIPKLIDSGTINMVAPTLEITKAKRVVNTASKISTIQEGK